jgi:hypothetical protein
LKTICAFLFVLLACAPELLAYGPLGHEIVGGIADELLAHKPAGAQISALIDGMTLKKASVVADEIKGWDKNGPDDLNQFPHYRDHLEIDRQLRDFWRANQPAHDMRTAAPSHHWFHYTDVPVIRGEKYADGKAGRSRWDIVHMIPYCVSVLEGETPEANERKITKPVAVILLAHYVGDIHQPLHVGAKYFDNSGRVIDPDKGQPYLADEGGNTFALHLKDEPPPRRGVHTKKFHGFWDFDAVNALLPQIPKTMSKYERRKQIDAAKIELIHKLATHEPQGWRMPPRLDIKTYAECWANEILPIACEAHERLQFSDVKALQEEEGRIVASGQAREKPSVDGVAYREWAKNIAREELHKAGWRVADLLEKTLRPKGEAAAVGTIAAEPTPSSSKPTRMLDRVVFAPTGESTYGRYPVNQKEM